MADDTQRQTYPGKGKMAADGNKEKSSKGGFNVDAGSKNHMIQGTSAAPQVAGQSASQKSGGGKFAAGGNGHMFADEKASPAAAGQSGHNSSGGDDKFSVKGGTTKMFGPQCADPAKPA